MSTSYPEQAKVAPALRCSWCGEVKAIDAFNHDKSRPSGRHPYCAECVRIRRHKGTRPLRTHCKNGHELTPENTRVTARQRKCRTCDRAPSQRWKHETQIRWKYGIGADDYDALLAAQGGKCAICGERDKGRLCVDHHHGSGRVRGLLCTPCNQAIGHLRDDAERARKLVAYLDNPPADGVIGLNRLPPRGRSEPTTSQLAAVAPHARPPRRMGKLNAEQREAIRSRVASGTHGTYTALAKEYGVCQRTIRDIVKGRTWNE